jgi:hypothetical protein
MLAMLGKEDESQSIYTKRMCTFARIIAHGQ